ncbi:MAG: hypothetical protein WD069_15360 [Planctomycetales bacterium]
MSHFPVVAVNGTAYVVNPGRRIIQEEGAPDNCLPLPELKPQEIEFDHPQSCCRFHPDASKPFVATPGAIDRFGDVVICGCLALLQQLAETHAGIDSLQAFVDSASGAKLWFIEDGEGGAITALLPDEY